MGIDFSHCDAGWSYGGFNRFRTRLAKSIGVDLNLMQGFDGQTSWETVKDDIKGLLDHSDCDGELSPIECKVIAPRLRELVEDWEDGYDKQQALELANGMESAVESNQHLLFQ